MKKLMSVMALFVIGLLAVSMVSASVGDSLQITEIDINGQDDITFYTEDEVDASNVDNLDSVAVDEGEILEISVELEASADLENIQIEAELYGYEYDDYQDLEDETHTFDMEVSGTGTTSRVKDLEIDLPNKLEKDRYLLKISIDGQDITSLVNYVVLQIEPSRHGLDIADVVFSPGSTVKAGRSLLTTVLLQNYGDKDETDVKVTVAVPALGISATEYVDEVNTDSNNIDYEDVEEMFLPIPATAEEGDYEVEVTVEYDEYETVSKTYDLHVLANELYQTSDKLILAVGPESQTVAAGNTATYAIALTNEGTASKAYVLEAVTGDWATASLSDTLVVLSAGQNKIVYVDVAVAGNAVEGAHVASVAVKAEGEVLQAISLNANVVAGSDDFNLRNGLEVALIVLVVLLVIVGLIIGFSRLRQDEEDEEQTYY